MTLFLIIFLTLNVLAFALYGIDKHRAKEHAWRIPERVLLGVAVLLGGLGAWIGMQLWRHKTKRKVFCRWVPIAALLQIVPLLLVFGAAWYMLDYSLKPGGREEREAWVRERLERNHPGTTAWAEDLIGRGVLRDTFIVNEEGLRLHAFYASHPQARGTVVLAHGYTDSAWGMMMLGRMYRDDLQFNILLPEHERHGLSQGDAIQMGWQDRLNLELWIDAAIRLWPRQDVYLHGISMGAATVMMCSGDELPPQVRGIVADCGYTSVWDEFSGEIQNQFGLPVHPLLDVASWLCNLRYGWDFKEASALEQVSRSELPILFIHGDADTFVPTAMVYRLYDAKRKGLRRLWVAEGTVHAEAYKDYPERYLQEVVHFIADTKHQGYERDTKKPGPGRGH